MFWEYRQETPHLHQAQRRRKQYHRQIWALSLGLPAGNSASSSSAKALDGSVGEGECGVSYAGQRVYTEALGLPAGNSASSSSAKAPLEVSAKAKLTPHAYVPVEASPRDAAQKSCERCGVRIPGRMPGACEKPGSCEKNGVALK